MKAFYKQSTQYYLRSSQMFHTNLIRSPALFLISNVDPVGPVSSNMRVRDSWESLGIKVKTNIDMDIFVTIQIFLPINFNLFNCRLMSKYLMDHHM